MRKLIALLAFITITASLFANEYVTVTSNKNLEYHEHETYEVWYNKDTKNPEYVIWNLTNEDAILSDAGKNRYDGSFVKCASAPTASRNYKGSGYDQGHMCPNNDRDWSKESSKETFRACNIAPQTPSLNRGTWQKYEKEAHNYAKKYGIVTILCGPIYDNTKQAQFIGKDNVRVPDAFFKVFYYNNRIECYIFYQNNTFQPSTVEEIQKLTKINIVFNGKN